MVAAILFSVVALVPHVVVSGSETCPTPAEVSAELEALLNRPGTTPAAYRAHVTSVGETVRVEVATGEGVRMGERELRRTGSCQDVARSAAAVIASWVGLFEAEAPVPVEASSRVAPRTTDDGGGGGEPRVSPPTSPMVMPTSTSTSARLPAATDPPGTKFWATIGLLGSRAGGDTAGGGEVAVVALRANQRLAARFGLFGTSVHNLSGFQGGSAHWRRLGADLGPAWVGDRSGWRGEAHAALTAALLHVQGAGFDFNDSFSALTLGGAAGIRLARRWGSAAPFVGLDAVYFAGHERLFVEGLPQTGEVPPFELHLIVGFSLNGGP